MNRKNKPLNFTKDNKKEHRNTIEQRRSHTNDHSIKTTSLSSSKKKARKYKRKAKDEKKEPHIVEKNAVEDGKEGKVSLSSNWDEFLKETKKLKEQTNGLYVKSRPGQKRKIHEKSNQIKQRKRTKEEPHVEETSTLKESDIWFDDVDIEEIEHAIGKKLKFSSDKHMESNDHDVTAKEDAQNSDRKPSITKRLAIDCEMVGVGIDGKESMLARVSIVNSFCDTVYDTFVAPMQEVVDYRTEFSGVRPQDLVDAPQFSDVQRHVANITEDKILVGHSIRNDLKALLLSHSRKNIRDTATYKPFKKLLKTKFPSLKKLTKEVLNIDIQSGEHSSVEDAKCTMKIYQLHKKKWESSLKEKGYKNVIEDSSKVFIGRNTDYHKKRFKRFQRLQRQRRKERKSRIKR